MVFIQILNFLNFYLIFLKKIDLKMTGNSDENRKASLKKKEAQENLKTVLCEDGKWFVDYVRLRFKGVKVL